MKIIDCFNTIYATWAWSTLILYAVGMKGSHAVSGHEKAEPRTKSTTMTFSVLQETGRMLGILDPPSIKEKERLKTTKTQCRSGKCTKGLHLAKIDADKMQKYWSKGKKEITGGLNKIQDELNGLQTFKRTHFNRGVIERCSSRKATTDGIFVRPSKICKNNIRDMALNVKMKTKNIKKQLMNLFPLKKAWIKHKMEKKKQLSQLKALKKARLLDHDAKMKIKYEKRLLLKQSDLLKAKFDSKAKALKSQNKSLAKKFKIQSKLLIEENNLLLKELASEKRKLDKESRERKCGEALLRKQLEQGKSILSDQLKLQIKNQAILKRTQKAEEKLRKALGKEKLKENKVMAVLQLALKREKQLNTLLHKVQLDGKKRNFEVETNFKLQLLKETKDKCLKDKIKVTPCKEEIKVVECRHGMKVPRCKDQQIQQDICLKMATDRYKQGLAGKRLKEFQDTLKSKFPRKTRSCRDNLRIKKCKKRRIFKCTNDSRLQKGKAFTSKERCLGSKTLLEPVSQRLEILMEREKELLMELEDQRSARDFLLQRENKCLKASRTIKAHQAAVKKSSNLNSQDMCKTPNGATIIQRHNKVNFSKPCSRSSKTTKKHSRKKLGGTIANIRDICNHIKGQQIEVTFKDKQIAVLKEKCSKCLTSSSGQVLPASSSEQIHVLSDAVRNLLADMSMMNHQQSEIALSSLKKSCELDRSLDDELDWLGKLMCSLKVERQCYDVKISALQKELSRIKLQGLKERRALLRGALQAKLAAMKKRQSAATVVLTPQICAISSKCQNLLLREAEIKENKIRFEKERYWNAMREAKRKYCVATREKQLSRLRKNCL